MGSAARGLEPGIARVSIETDRSSALRWITQSQLDWARAMGLEVADGNRASSIEANLFRPLHPETLKEFEVGKGDELGSVGRPGKMASLISSSALAVNVFDVWRGNSCAALCEALGVEPAYSVAGFEATYPTGLRGTDPHLDIELSAAGWPVVAVESKFTEPYRSVTNSFRPSYFSSDRTWAGLSASRSLAERIADNEITFSFAARGSATKTRDRPDQNRGDRPFRPDIPLVSSSRRTRNTASGADRAIRRIGGI